MDVAERADGHRRDDGRGLEAFAPAARNGAPRVRDPDPLYRGRVADAGGSDLLGQPQRHRSRALRDAVRFPPLVRVKALPARDRLLAQVRKQRGALDRLAGERQRGELAGTDGVRCRARVAHPGPDREPVEPIGLRVRPGVVGVNALDQRAERLLDPGVARSVLVGHPGEVVADEAPLGEHVGVLTGDRGEGGLDRQPKILDQSAVGRLEGAGHLAAELHEASVGHLRLHNPPTGPVAGLQHEDIGAPRLRSSAADIPASPAPTTTTSCLAILLLSHLAPYWSPSGATSISAKICTSSRISRSTPPTVVGRPQEHQRLSTGP